MADMASEAVAELRRIRDSAIQFPTWRLLPEPIVEPLSVALDNLTPTLELVLSALNSERDELDIALDRVGLSGSQLEAKRQLNTWTSLQVETRFRMAFETQRELEELERQLQRDDLPDEPGWTEALRSRRGILNRRLGALTNLLRRALGHRLATLDIGLDSLATILLVVEPICELKKVFALGLNRPPDT
jgi:hypothetical protein